MLYLKWIIKHTLLPLSIITVGLFTLGLSLIFRYTPTDVVQGSVMRILYIHVPCAWLALLIYSWTSFLSFLFLIFRWPLIWPFIQESIPIGACFTFLALITGSIWGKPTWGAWWVWDARLTSMLILFLLYIGILSLSKALQRNLWNYLLVACFILVGAINLPIIHYSVIWWHTLHQEASILQLSRPTMDFPMLISLFIMLFAHLSLFIFLLLLNIDCRIQEQKQP